ncbi:uncharacterized protein LOC134719787 [Mytilus trossulus]|uniref:uncharacterized protein LOC134719787 n=1 Tax=Mytilus trossulus TaxID=6551 RepID=UPI0030048A04
MKMEMSKAIFIFIALSTLQTNYGQNCKIKPKEINDAVEGIQVTPFYKTLSSLGPHGCLNECIRRRDCVFFNYNWDSRSCELCYNTTESSTKPVEGYFYKDVTTERGGQSDPCVGTTCSMGEICVVLYNKNTVCIVDG